MYRCKQSEKHRSHSRARGTVRSGAPQGGRGSAWRACAVLRGVPSLRRSDGVVGRSYAVVRRHRTAVRCRSSRTRLRQAVRSALRISVCLLRRIRLLKLPQVRQGTLFAFLRARAGAASAVPLASLLARHTGCLAGLPVAASPCATPFPKSKQSPFGHPTHRNLPPLESPLKR